jgi:hypothetical protein
MDEARISAHHWKIMFISGMGFFTDAYDLFIIGVVMTSSSRCGTSTRSRRASSNPPRCSPLRSALCSSVA